MSTEVTTENREALTSAPPRRLLSQSPAFDGLARKSKALDTDESFSYTFTEPGTYPYFCSIHPKMVANITVTAK